MSSGRGKHSCSDVSQRFMPLSEPIARQVWENWMWTNLWIHCFSYAGLRLDHQNHGEQEYSTWPSPRTSFPGFCDGMRAAILSAWRLMFLVNSGLGWQDIDMDLNLPERIERIHPLALSIEEQILLLKSRDFTQEVLVPKLHKGAHCASAKYPIRSQSLKASSPTIMLYWGISLTTLCHPGFSYVERPFACPYFTNLCLRRSLPRPRFPSPCSAMMQSIQRNCTSEIASTLCKYWSLNGGSMSRDGGDRSRHFNLPMSCETVVAMIFETSI